MFVWGLPMQAVKADNVVELHDGAEDPPSN